MNVSVDKLSVEFCICDVCELTATTTAAAAAAAAPVAAVAAAAATIVAAAVAFTTTATIAAATTATTGTTTTTTSSSTSATDDNDDDHNDVFLLLTSFSLNLHVINFSTLFSLHLLSTVLNMPKIHRFQDSKIQGRPLVFTFVIPPVNLNLWNVVGKREERGGGGREGKRWGETNRQTDRQRDYACI